MYATHKPHVRLTSIDESVETENMHNCHNTLANYCLYQNPIESIITPSRTPS